MQTSLLNNLAEAAAFEALNRCCGAQEWCRQMVALRPFESSAQLFACADDIWWNLSEADWLEAFTHHPKIGDIDSLRAKFATTREWAGNEQSSVKDAHTAVLQGLADGNLEYEQKFGYIFIVCATGKSAEEMLAILRQRLPNSLDQELRIAAAEQCKITHLRLEKLCQEVQSQPMC